MTPLTFQPYYEQLTIHKDNWDGFYGEGSFVRHFEYYITRTGVVPDQFLNFMSYYPELVVMTFVSSINNKAA